jgi:DNA-binding response OmpR family regulator
MISNNPAGAAEIMVLAGTQEDLSLLSAMLSSHGYQVRPVNSAELALSSFKSRKPDLILMDAGYSDMSVDDLCRKIRESGPATDIPMIFITQMDDAGRAAGQQVEGADFITRPCREEDLLRKVQVQLESHLKQKEHEGLHQSLYAAQETLRTMLKLVSGSININGDAATMGYIHSLYSSLDDPSTITIQGSTFARSIKTEKDAVHSSINLNNAYTSDNLQIDSDQSAINVSGAYYGFVTGSYDIDGSGNSGNDLADSYIIVEKSAGINYGFPYYSISAAFNASCIGTFSCVIM